MITAGSVTNGAASPGQQVITGKRAEVDLVAAQDDLLAGAAAHDLGTRVGDRLQRAQTPNLGGEPFGRLHLEHVGEPGRDLVEALDAEREAHATLGAELVDQQRVLRTARPLEQQRRATGLDRPVDDLRHLEVRIDLGGDSPELTLAFEKRDPLPEVAERHRGSVYGAPPGPTRVSL